MHSDDEIDQTDYAAAYTVRLKSSRTMSVKKI
jgi:hypothetical protein